MIVTQLFVYPVKSLPGVSLQKSLVTDRGLAYDRRWVLVDKTGFHVTQREYPELVHLKQRLNLNGIEITNNLTGGKVIVPFLESNAPSEAIRVWDDEFMATEVSHEVSTWFSAFLKKEVKLMFQPEESRRAIDERYRLTENDVVSNADGYPILIISEESLNDLNARLDEPVEMLRFRPNIVISGVNPYGEDELNSIGIGEAEVIGVKNCSRCIMTTNKLDGQPRDKEPLKTLANYRRVGTKVLFGRNFLIKKEGEIELGMKVNKL